MRQLKKYLFIILLFVEIPIQAQLNEFLVEWYFSDCDYALNTDTVPWRKNISEGTLDFFQTMKQKYNFNTVFFITYDGQYPINSDETYSYDFLSMSKNAGLKAILRTAYLSSETRFLKRNQGFFLFFNKKKANQDLSKFSNDSSNVIGYHIADEPEATNIYTHYDLNNTSVKYNLHYIFLNKMIEYIPDYSLTIKKYDSSLLRFSNLNPAYAGFSDQYYREDKIQRTIDITKPNLLSYDDYPMWYENPSNTFFTTLYDFGMKSVENSIPFIYVLTPSASYKSYFDDDTPETENCPTNYEQYPAKTLPQFYYSIYAALAYGAKGIAYWPGFQWVECLRGDKRIPYALSYGSGVLDALGTLHGKLIENSETLLSLNFVSAYHVSKASTTSPYTTYTNEDIPSFSLWTNFKNDKYAKQIFSSLNNPIIDNNLLPKRLPSELVVTFLKNNLGQIYFWLFNKSLTRNMNLSLQLTSQTILNVLNSNVANPSSILLSPGEAKLFTLSTSPTLTTTISNVAYNIIDPISTTGFFPFESATTIIADGVVVNDGVTKSFIAKEIDIKNTSFKQGSTVRLSSYTQSNNGIQRAPSQVTNLPIEEKSIINSDVSVYPNPTINDVTLNTGIKGNESIKITIYDSMGRLIKTIETSSEETTISLQGQPDGLYLIHFVKEGKLYSFKINKQNN